MSEQATMQARRYKVGTMLPCYCDAQHLVGVIEDCRLSAGSHHVMVTQHDSVCPGERNRFAVISVKRHGPEYRVQLGRYASIV